VFAHLALQKLPHPESDLGLLARVRLNLFSTLPHRRFTRVMNDRQKRKPKNEGKSARKNAKYAAQNAKKYRCNYESR
jgi:hypothetical protein